MSRRETLRIFLPLGCYFLVHLLLKVLLSDGVELDEAEQFLWAQSLHLGYGAELPLYTWLQWGFFALFGTNVFALALLKDLLLFATCLFTYLGGREASNDGRGAALSMFTLILIPQIVWESQRVLTHMVLATALMAMALYFFLRIVNRGQLRHYLLFGCCAGLGMLAKYNVAILLLALLLAALSLPSYRSSFADRRWYAALALFLVIIAAPFSWLALHPDLALAKSYKLHADGGGGILAGVRNLAGAAVAFSSVPLLLFALIFSRAPRIHADDSRISERTRLMGRTLLFALLICLLLILCCHVTQFRVRWMQPLLLPLPLFLSLLVHRRLTDRNQRWVRLLAASAAVAVLIIMNGRILLASHFRPTSQNEPYSRLAEQITAKGFSGGVIVAEGRYLGGNLQRHFPSSRVITPDTPLLEPLPASLPLLVVWSGERKQGMPDELDRFLRQRFAPLATPPAPLTAEARYRYDADRTMRLDFVILRP